MVKIAAIDGEEERITWALLGRHDLGHDAAFKRDLSIITRTYAKLVVAGDLNARHRMWNNMRSNTNGRLLFDHAQQGHYTVEYPDSPTYVTSRGSSSTLDIFLNNVGIGKPVTLDELNSGHFPVLTKVTFTASRSPKLQRKDFLSVDWARFGRFMDGELHETECNTVEEIDLAIDMVERAIKKSEQVCVRTMPVTSEFVNIDPYTLELIQMRNRYRRVFQNTSNRLYKGQAASLARVISSKIADKRNANFERVVSRMDVRIPPFWKVAKILKQRSKPVPPLTVSGNILVTPYEKCNAIAAQFASAHLLGTLLKA
uniref:Endo/exonuclease/phosphatase domain-containing protein n=1 Tax=Anopheles stephensi TaxID=30069 RepID=A0A182YRN9_ANOST